jgi:hypothetical protein
MIDGRLLPISRACIVWLRCTLLPTVNIMIRAHNRHQPYLHLLRYIIFQSCNMLSYYRIVAHFL